MAVIFAGDLVALGKDVLRVEAEAVLSASSKLGDDFARATELVLSCIGRVVVTGVGKSGHVGRKIAATLASTGTPAFFVHAGEAGHGDLGMITQGDVLVALSNSGETDEVIDFVSFARRFGAKVIGITGNPNSRLAELCEHHLNSSVLTEACPIGVAPTASTTVQLALGDALAMATVAARGFTTQDFARTHPMGALGRKYFLRVRDIMQPLNEIPQSSSKMPLIDVIPEMATGRAGAIVLIDGDRLSGIFTDSDLRRLILQSRGEFDRKLELPVSEFMTTNPKTISASLLASEALRVFEERRISRIVCMDDEHPVGLLAWHDLLQSKVT